MRFNRYVFDNFMETEYGKKCRDFFTHFPEMITDRKTGEMVEFLNAQYMKPVEREEVDEILAIIANAMQQDADEEVKKKAEGVDSIESAEVFHRDYIQMSLENGIKPRDLITYTTEISIILHLNFPDFFFPYFFVNHFFKLEAIFREFEIPLPTPPTKRKYEDRLYYYFELCKALHDYRLTKDLSEIDLNVFLYFYAQKIIDDFSITDSTMPSAAKVYISGATREDTEWIEKIDSKKESGLWAGNLNMVPGDVLLVYGVKPYSGIGSLWRALSVGFYDPFSYWTDRVWVGRPIRIPKISYDDLKMNPVWSEKGIVKSHMQGVSGTPCTKREYEEIMSILGQKGFDTVVLPVLEGPEIETGQELVNEKDIEEKLLEPLLMKLGYTEQDWVRQMPVRMGRGERIYPDYALFPKQKKGEESARFIWEAKYRIPDRKKLIDDFYQAKSYAMRLGARGLGLVSIEGIWLSFREDSFYSSRLQHFDWNTLNEPDTFRRILEKVGRNIANK